MVENLNINRFVDLAEIVEAYDTHKWIFRGVRNSDYRLVPSIGRWQKARRPYNEDDEIALLARFERETRPFYKAERRPSYILRNWDLQALAQHHGLATRLLDWSESPLIAAYFAVESAGEDATDSALYAVRCPPEIISDLDKRPDSVVALYPPHLTPRITAQRGLFTVHPSPGEPWEPEGLVKWIIPFMARMDIKLSLNRAGINRASLFPGLDGIATHLNWCHEVASP